MEAVAVFPEGPELLEVNASTVVLVNDSIDGRKLTKRSGLLRKGRASYLRLIEVVAKLNTEVTELLRINGIGVVRIELTEHALHVLLETLDRAVVASGSLHPTNK